MAVRPKPELEDVERAVRDGESYWTDRDKRNVLWRDMHNNEHPVGVPLPPKGLLVQPYEMRTGKAAEIDDAAHSVFSTPSTHSIDTPGLGTRIHALTERVEKFFNAVRGQAEFECGEMTNDLVTFDVINPGFTGVVVLPYPQAWGKNYPKQGKGEEIPADEGFQAYNSRVAHFTTSAALPISIRHIPAATWYPQLDGRNVITSLQRKYVTPSWILSRYGGRKHENREPILSDSEIDLLRKQSDEAGPEGAGTIKLIEYADDTYCGWYCFEGKSGLAKELRIWPHRMPLPEGRAPAVLYEGLTTGDPRPQYRFKSLITDIYSAIQAEDFGLSQIATSALIYYYLTVIITLGERDTATDADIDVIKQSIQFGGPNVLLPGRTFSVLHPEGPLPSIEQLISLSAERIEGHWPSILSGQTPPGRSTGYMVQLVRDSALAVKQAIPKHLAQGDADTMRMVCYAVGGVARIAGRKDQKVYVRNVRTAGGEPVYVTWDDVRDMIPLIRAERKPTLPIDQTNQLDIVGKAISLRMPPPRAWTLYGDVEDPETMEEEMRAWEVEHSPPLADQFTQEVIAKMGLIRNMQEGMALQEAAALALPPAVQEGLGIPGPNGGSPMAPMPVTPPMAVPSPTTVPMETTGTVRAPRGAGRRIGQGARSGSKTRPKGPRPQPTAAPGGGESE